VIQLKEVQQKAREAGVRDQQIEKDYILSWILQGIAHHERLSKSIVFKGGTALKKVYFKDYRFSEDLDFTALNDEVSTNQILEWCKETFEYVLAEANIRLEIMGSDTQRVEQEDSRMNFYISYVGPLGGQGNKKKAKVDISRTEKLEFKPVLKNLLLGYSDLGEHQLLCYSLEEVLVEKMRSVIQRMQARDFYDIWYLVERHQLNPEFYLNEFASKCASKGLSGTDFPTKLQERLPQYKGRWQSSMSEQIKDLPNFEQVEREVQRHLKKLKL
jgi:uncharacterized protein